MVESRIVRRNGGIRRRGGDARQGTSFCCANPPHAPRLGCTSCSFGGRFAAGFLQISPRDEHPRLSLWVEQSSPTWDFHRSDGLIQI
jgi:hypothetical protein